MSTNRAGQEIRSCHPYAFRSGEWAVITTTTDVKGRWCYIVNWPDGLVDTWPIEDPTANYEFREPTP